MKWIDRWAPWVGMLALALAASVSHAGEITLESPDGSIAVSGKLIDFDGEFWRLETRFGEMTLRALGVTCKGADCPDPGKYAADLRLGGDTAMLEEFLARLIEDFSTSKGLTSLRTNHPNLGWSYFITDANSVPLARLMARPASGAAGLRDLRRKKADIVALSRAAGAPFDAGLRHQIVALDAIVFAVAPENPVTALTPAQIRKIWSGEITNWAEIGGYDAPIILYLPRPDSDLAKGLEADFSLPGWPAKKVARKVFDSLVSLSDALTNDAFGLGVVDFGTVRNNVSLALRGECGIMQSPDRFGIQSGDYPLTRVLSLVTRKERLPVFAREFLAWLEKPQAQRSVADLGFVDLMPEQQPLSRQQHRLSNAILNAADDVTLADLKRLVTRLRGARRLALTIRFSGNSTALDPRSTRAVNLVAQMMEAGDFDGRELIFAGFSDSEGSAKGNLEISKKRAAQALALVRKKARRAAAGAVRLSPIGFGEISPLACNDSDSGRRRNRRVEIWVR